MRENVEDVWLLAKAHRSGPGFQHILSFVALVVVGTVVGTLGAVSMPVGFHVSAFWPAMTLQVIGGLWFGAWGVLAGVVFAALSHLLSGGELAGMWGFIPANVVQAGLTAWIFRRWRLDPALPSRREVVVFVVVGTILSNVLGGLLGIAALAWSGEMHSQAQAFSVLFSWVVGNALPCLLLGIPLLRALSPLVIDSPFFCRTWWGGSLCWRAVGRLTELPLVVRLWLGFSVAGVLPLLAVSVATIPLLRPVNSPVADIVLPIMLNLSIFLSLIIGGQLAQNIGQRAQTLCDGARRLGEGDLSYRVPVEGTDELARLATAFNQMGSALATARDEIYRTTAERERSQRDLEIAHDIQQDFLPQTFPEMAGADVAAAMYPALVIGGDFYDVLPLGGGRLGVLIADVSGKGIPAALYMALSVTLLRTHSFSARPRYLSDALESAQVRQLMRSGSLGALAALGSIRQANEYLVEHHVQSSMFLTLFYAVYEPHSHLLTYVNAGHNPPLLYNALTDELDWLMPTDMVIGLMPDRPYEAQERQLKPGDILVMYTDGVTEAFNSQREMFEQERLAEVVRAHRDASAQEIVLAIREAVAAFTGDAPQSDDLTLLVLCCRSDGL